MSALSCIPIYCCDQSVFNCNEAGSDRQTKKQALADAATTFATTAPATRDAVYPEIKILILSQLSSSESIRKVMKLGANGYFTKNSEPERLMSAILSIDDKGFYFEEELGKVLRDLMINSEIEESPP